MAKTDGLNTRLLLRNVRLSYLHIFEPAAIADGAQEKYSATIMMPKEGPFAAENLAAVQDAVEALKNKVKTANKNKLPAKFDICLRDGDNEADRGNKGDEFLGHWFINAKSNDKPGIVGTMLDENNKPKSLAPGEFKSGDWGRVSITLYDYSQAGNNGIAAALNNLQKTRDGESLSGRTSAATEFEGLGDDDLDGTEDNGGSEEEDWG